MGRRCACAVWAAGAVVGARRRRRLGLPRPLSAVLAASVPAAVAVVARGGARAPLVWAAHMWAYKLEFEIPYDAPERLRARLRVLYPLRADAWLGVGRPPGERLQTALREPLAVNPLDRALTAVYLTWELEPHAALAWILLRHRERFPRAAVRLALAFDATL
ncbi:MAG TPA: phosphoesterase, partial [Solirubrobacter sp.]|nr:phosphoesterase [Solirubrobacter sp.]